MLVELRGFGLALYAQLSDWHLMSSSYLNIIAHFLYKRKAAKWRRTRKCKNNNPV